MLILIPKTAQLASFLLYLSKFASVRLSIDKSFLFHPNLVAAVSCIVEDSLLAVA